MAYQTKTFSDCETGIQYNLKTRYIAVSSLDRNLSTFPYSSDFTVSLSEPLRNVHSASLVSAVIPYGTKPLVLLQVPEFGDLVEFTNGILSPVFAVVPTPMTNVTTYSSDEQITKTWSTNVASISKLTVRLVDGQGNPLNLGNGTLADASQTLFVFKVECAVASGDSSRFRNVF
jgi:hypothetical protein